MSIAEQAAFPAAEAMPGHGNWNGHVNTHHAHLYAARKFAGRMAIAGKARPAVAELMPIEQADGRAQIVDVHAGQHRTTDLSPLEFTVGPHVVKPSSAHTHYSFVSAPPIT